PTITDPSIMSLAWFTKGAAPTTTITFTWSIDYSFVWAQTGLLKAGVVFQAGQVWPADLSTRNQVTLTQENEVYTFENQTTGAATGNLYITEDPSILADQVAVGVGMSGSGTFVKQGQPNWNLTFTPHPQYWIAFGSYTHGEVMDISSMSDAGLIQFPPNEYSMTVTLNPDNTWTIVPTSQANAAFLEAKRSQTWGQQMGAALLRAASE
ncbi:MAG TPA: hypothetical protein VGB66_08440, partial [Longimicrobium sp.]